MVTAKTFRHAPARTCSQDHIRNWQEIISCKDTVDIAVYVVLKLLRDKLLYMSTSQFSFTCRRNVVFMNARTMYAITGATIATDAPSLIQARLKPIISGKDRGLCVCTCVTTVIQFTRPFVDETGSL